MHMVMNSQCKIPTRNWNGKVLNIRVATNHMDYDHRPRNHNILHRRNATNDRRLSSNDNDNGNIKQKQKQHKIIVFGTHHRTGTHFAHKLFATICANQGWCCLMHPTRDSIDAIKASLEAEDVYVLGHSQWIWNPKEIFGENNDNDNDYQYQHQHQYRFFHFYRNPIKKIISGYLYHRDGMESWTQKQLNYKHLCDNNMYSIRNDTDGEVGNLRKSRVDVSRSDVVDYCHATKLCETCCRRAHEKKHSFVLASSSSNKDKGKGEGYLMRDKFEYEYLCKNLGNVQTSLQDSLLSSSVETGLAIEASLDYYESLRMATILEGTKDDVNTINIDLDSLKENFTETLEKILNHMDVKLSPEDHKALINLLQFLDISKSSLYRFSMNNWFNRHVSTDVDVDVDLNDVTNEKKRSLLISGNGNSDGIDVDVDFGVGVGSGASYSKILLNQPDFVRLYGPILEKMKQFGEGGVRRRQGV
jgi:hypothetical protein